MLAPNKYFVIIIIIIMERVEELSSQFTEHCVQVSSQSTVFKSVHRGLCSSQFTEHCVQVSSQRTVFKSVAEDCVQGNSRQFTVECVQISS